jgi:hypothetical protein
MRKKLNVSHYEDQLLKTVALIFLKEELFLHQHNVNAFKRCKIFASMGNFTW